MSQPHFQPQHLGDEHDSDDQPEQLDDLDPVLADLLVSSRRRRTSLLRFIARHIARQLRAEHLQRSELSHADHDV